MNDNEKNKKIAALKVANDNTLVEQDFHRERIETMGKIGNKNYYKELPSIGWDGVSSAMQDECSPPCSQERKKYLDQNWDEIPTRLQLENIEDTDIRSHTYFLGEVVEHTQRIKSIAKFLEVLNASPDDRFCDLLYTYWVKHNVCTQLANEQLEIGNEKKAATMKVSANVMAKVFGILAESPGLPEKFPLNDEELPDSLKQLLNTGKF